MSPALCVAASLMAAGLLSACTPNRVQADATSVVERAAPSPRGAAREAPRPRDRQVLRGAETPSGETLSAETLSGETQPALTQLPAREIGGSMQTQHDDSASPDVSTQDLRPPPVPRERLDAAKARYLAARRSGGAIAHH